MHLFSLEYHLSRRYITSLTRAYKSCSHEAASIERKVHELIRRAKRITFYSSRNIDHAIKLEHLL